MNRNEILSSLKAKPEVSVLIVGAGINGIGTFRDLALNGVDVLLIDRADGIINICEIKFVNAPFTITAEYLKKLQLKIASFQHFTKTRKTLFPTMVTTFGLVDNLHSSGFIQQSVEVKDLFL